MDRNTPWRRGPAWAAVCALVCLSGAAAAQPTPARAAAAFERGPASDQLALDVTPIPPGMGALFVPSATDPALEPELVVRLGEERVAWSRTGRRVVVPPGDYEVLLGDGPVEQRARTTVKVLAGVTTPTPRFYAALRVTAVDTDGRPVPVPYRLQGRAGDVRGQATTAAEPDYRATRTWLLSPGPVELVLDGTGAERHAVALWLPQGETVRYRLVMAQGRLVRAELADTELVAVERWWRARWVVGGDASFSRTSGRLGAFNGDFLRAGINTEAEVGIDHGAHLATATLRVNEAWIGLNGPGSDDFASQKFDDEVGLELLYNYRPGRIAGPYVRGAVATALFPTRFEATRTLRWEERDGSAVVDSGTLDAGEDLRLFDRFEPLELRGGAGLALTAVDTRTVTLMARVGAGVRDARYGGGRYIDDVSGDSVSLVRIADDESFGAEARIQAGLRVGQQLQLELGLDAYIPRAQLTDDDPLRPILNLSGAAAFALSPALSLIYEVSLAREAYEIETLQFSDLLSLRVQHTLF